MKNLLLCLLASLWLPSVQAESAATLAEDVSGSERVCWFQDHQYSQGARILLGDIWLECAPHGDPESDGPLDWQSAVVVLPATKGVSGHKAISVGQ